MPQRRKRLAVLDIETDPFNGSPVYPFAAGFYDGKRAALYWGTNAVDSLSKMISGLPDEYVIYAHNGGRFDFFYLLDYINRSDVTILDGRIVRCHLGRHQLRDSYAILPFSLGAYKKENIDYRLFTRDRRERARVQILEYLSHDLTYLYELVSRFRDEFGDVLTIGSAAMKEIRKFHPFTKSSRDYDQDYRARFFHGGRNELFQPGITEGNLEVTDVNSMYPSVMAETSHPIGTTVECGGKVKEGTIFLRVRGQSDGAFAVRNHDTFNLDFPYMYGDFDTTIHEFNAAVEIGAFHCDKVLTAYTWALRSCFDQFVNHYHRKRAACQEQSDTAGDLIYKHILTGSYGKFAQNPDRYSDFYLSEYGEVPSHGEIASGHYPDGWRPHVLSPTVSHMIWARPAIHVIHYNVATAASITGAARAKLLRELYATPRPIYCDTDSIICHRHSGSKETSSDLGRWRRECQPAMAAMARKKVYALFDAEGACIKKASAGIDATPAEILRAAKGEPVTKIDNAPTWGLDGTMSFRKTTLRRAI